MLMLLQCFQWSVSYICKHNVPLEYSTDVCKAGHHSYLKQPHWQPLIVCTSWIISSFTVSHHNYLYTPSNRACYVTVTAVSVLGLLLCHLHLTHILFRLLLQTDVETSYLLAGTKGKLHSDMLMEWGPQHFHLLSHPCSSTKLSKKTGVKGTLLFSLSTYSFPMSWYWQPVFDICN